MKTTVVVLGGLWYSPRLYQEMSEYFGHAGFEVVVPDLTGKDLFSRVGAVYGATRKLGETEFVLVAHSFGAIVGHRLIEIHPELEERIKLFVALGALSPYGVERFVSIRLALTYPVKFLRELFGETFSPSFTEFKRESGGALESEFLCLNPEPASLLRGLVFRGLSGPRCAAPLVSYRFTCPVRFFNGDEDRLVTQRSLEHWERHYNGGKCMYGADERFCSIGGATHHRLVTDQYVFRTIQNICARRVA